MCLKNNKQKEFHNKDIVTICNDEKKKFWYFRFWSNFYKRHSRMKKRNVAVSGNEKNSSETKEPCHFRCINCGRGACDLFKDYNNGIIKMKHCVINIFFLIFNICFDKLMSLALNGYLNISYLQEWKRILTTYLVPLLKILLIQWGKGLCNFDMYIYMYSIFEHASPSREQRSRRFDQFVVNK